MIEVVWLVALALMLRALIELCRERPRNDGASWFAILPFMVEPKKARGKIQQTKANRAKKRRNRS